MKPRATAAAPLPAGAMVGAAKPEELDVVAEPEEAVALEPAAVEVVAAVAVAVAVAEVAVLEESSATSLGGDWVPQRSRMLVLQDSWPSWLPTLEAMHWLYNSWQMKLGSVWL